MPMIVSITDQKGGLGKSTIPILLVPTLAKSQENPSQNILILDTDSQDLIPKILELEERINPNIKKLIPVEYIESSRVSRLGS